MANGGQGTAYSVAQTLIAIALETTRGVPESQHSYLIPVKGPKYKPDLAYIPDETLQGSQVSVYDEVPGVRYDTHGWSAPPYLDSFPLFLAMEFGSADTLTAAPAATTLAAAATSGSTSITLAASVPVGSYITFGSGRLETHLVTAISGASPYVATLATPVINNQTAGTTVTGLTKHQYSLLNNANTPGDQPPSATIWDFDGEQWRQLSACQLDELNIKGNLTGLVDYTITLMGNAALNNVTAPTISSTGVQTPAPFAFNIAINGTPVQTVTDWEFDFKRNTKPIPALTGTQEYYSYYASTLTCTGKFTLVEQSGSPYLSSYLNDVPQSIDVTIFDVQSGFALNIHSSKAKFVTGEIDRGKEYVDVPITVQFLPSSTDALAGGISPLVLTVANTVTTAYN